jgi:hypothetical protein
LENESADGRSWRKKRKRGERVLCAIHFFPGRNPNHPLTLEEIFQGKQDSSRSKGRLLKWEPYDSEQQRYLLFGEFSASQTTILLHYSFIFVLTIPAE